jgi:hypothetical protein
MPEWEIIMTTPPNADLGNANTQARQQADRAGRGTRRQQVGRFCDGVSSRASRLVFVYGVSSLPSGWCVYFGYRAFVRKSIHWLSEERMPRSSTALHLLAGRPMGGARGQAIFRTVLEKALILVPYMKYSLLRFLFSDVCLVGFLVDGHGPRFDSIILPYCRFIADSVPW